MASSVLTRLLRASSALTPVLLATLVLAPAAMANPVGGTVTAGKAEITAPDPSTLVINQSTNRAIIDWQKFDIDPGETTRFIQPSSDSWTLNRVIGSQDPSRILGTLEANGNVVIVNPDGIHFGPGSRVDVNRLIATTSGISNNNFMSGNMIFDQPGSHSASIVNEGTITINDYGLGALVAPSVRNSGVITARLGQISLASGNTFTIDPYGDGLVKLSITDEIQNDIYDVATGKKVTDLVKNDGTLKANGGIVAMTAATARKIVNSVVNNTGIIEANTIGTRGGKIILGAQTASTKRSGAPRQLVRVSGKLSATAYPIPTRITVPTPAPEGRGKIEITGELIVATNATLDASGIYGGGTILIGGDYMGGNGDPNTIAGYNIPLENYVVPTASEVALDDNVAIIADGIENADGGKVIVWSDVATYSAADISARGGEESGNGGFIETSGHFLNVLKAADASAPNGTAGTWLLDPLNLELKRVANNNSTVTPGVTIFTNISIQGTLFPTIVGDNGVPTGANSIIDTAIIENSLNAGTSVRMITRGTVGPDDGDILLSDDIQKTAGGNAIFNINAIGDITIAPGVNVTSTSGTLEFLLYATDGAIIANNIGTINTNGGVFFMEARDGILLSSAANMPHNTGISLRSGVSPSAPVNVDIAFGSDVIKFSHDNTTATFANNAIQLLDAGPSTSTHIHLEGFDVALADGAITVSNNRLMNFLFFSNESFTAINGNNDIPEIKSTDGTGTVRLEYDPGATVPANQPVIEVAATNAPNCIGLDCVAPGVPPAVVTTTTPTDEVEQGVLNPEVDTNIPFTTPIVSASLSLFQDNTNYEILGDLALAEFTDFLTRELLKSAWSTGALNIWQDQLNNIALEGLVKSKLKELVAGGPAGWASLAKSAALGFIKTAIIEAYDEKIKEFGVSPLLRGPLKYVMNTAGDAAIFSFLHPKIAAQAPTFVLLTSAAVNTLQQITEASYVGIIAIKQHNAIHKQIAQFEQSAEDLLQLGYQLKQSGKTQESLAIFKLSKQAGNTAIEIRKIYPYETFLQAVLSF